jgi:hypothetical protein
VSIYRFDILQLTISEVVDSLLSNVGSFDSGEIRPAGDVIFVVVIITKVGSPSCKGFHGGTVGCAYETVCRACG